MSCLLHAKFNIMSTGSSSWACTQKLLENIPLLLTSMILNHLLTRLLSMDHHINSGTCLYLWWLTCNVLVERLTGPTPVQVAFSTRRLFHGKDALCDDSEINMVKAADGAMEAGIEDGLIKEALRIISTQTFFGVFAPRLDFRTYEAAGIYLGCLWGFLPHSARIFLSTFALMLVILIANGPDPPCFLVGKARVVRLLHFCFKFTVY